MGSKEELFNDELKRTVTLEELINEAGEIMADTYEDMGDQELWLDDSRILDWLESLIRRLFQLDWAQNELSEAINEAGKKIYSQRLKRQEACRKT